MLVAWKRHAQPQIPVPAAAQVWAGQYYKINRGLEVFYRTVYNSARETLDALVLFLFWVAILTSVVVLTLQQNGTNSDFSSFASGWSTLLRLSFGYVDYTSFSNGGQVHD
jgi:hypothetical protein